MVKKRKSATFYLAILNVLVFVVNVAMGGGNRFWIFMTGGGYLREYGEANLTIVTEQGQWWRLLTCGYLHMGIIHLVGNMAALEIIGTKIEKKIEPVRMFLIYNLGMMLTAFLWCLIFPEGWTVGASPGIFVLLGMLCVMLWEKNEKRIIGLSRYDKGYLLFYVIAGCFLGVGTIVGHLIGFIIGILVGGFYGKFLYTRVE
ncbi:MAG: rhomboid family intramembrane serine protease [Lachnospiraceae bacterium]|nr:rhomboid family intramembrane serine protease [Lachnospiraceae bacterium]